MAIVAHYVNKFGELGTFSHNTLFLIITKKLLEELLIDFRELVGEHTGENMAEAVWETLKLYGLHDRVGSMSHFNCLNKSYIFFLGPCFHA